MRTNIEKELWSKYFPNEEFDYDNFYDWSRENAFELLPLALEFSEKIKQEYADEFACAFAEWKDKYEMEYNFRAQHTHNIKELHEIFKQEINGL